MGKIALFVVLLDIVLLSCICNVSKSLGTNPPVKTIKTAVGDLFDCVDIYKQPAFNHPLLKDHEILMKPVGLFQEIPKGGKEDNRSFSNMELEDGGCPDGTVPVHRLQKSNETIGLSPDSDGGQDINGQNDLVEMWAVRQSLSRLYYGASAQINLFEVDKVGPTQESSAMVWLKNLDAPSPHKAIIQAGWSVSPATFNDSKTRLYISWSADGGLTSCINLQCPGFVQVHSKVALGKAFEKFSTYGGPQFYTYIYMYSDYRDNWWFAIHDLGNVVGYWPATLFWRFDHASRAVYGGQVRCKKGGLCPAMGNGHKPILKSKDIDKACFMRHVQVVGKEFRWEALEAWKEKRNVSNPNCHDVGDYVTDDPAYMFSFGGPPCKA